MKLEVDKDWLVRRAALEGDLEVGAGGLEASPPPPPHAKAMLFGMAAAPAAACLQILVLVAVFGSFGRAGVGIAEAVLGSGILLVPVLILSYVIGALPTLVGAFLMHPVIKANYSPLTEYLAAAAIGALVVAGHAVIFLRAELLPVWMIGVLPGMAGVWAYRRVNPRPQV